MRNYFVWRRLVMKFCMEETCNEELFCMEETCNEE